MKLRNKKTGGLANIIGEQDFFRVYTDAGWADYNSLAELNEEWEDYVPKEPLIKDEKIRKAVRAWADANGFTDLMFGEWSDNHWFLRGVNEDGHNFDIDFFDVASRNLPKYVQRCFYTIAELCGEEETPEPIEPTFIDLDEQIKKKEEK